MMNLVHLSYDSANYYLIQPKSGWIMIDTGWAGTFPKLLHLLKRHDVRVTEIRTLVITHLHPDHAGLVEELKDHGTKLLLHHAQVSSVPQLDQFFKPRHGFRAIQARNNIVVNSAESRALLSQAGVSGELIPTPGHSDDSISLVIDGCCAFTGDLPRATMVPAEGRARVEASWAAIRQLGVKRIYPGHGNPFAL